MEGHAIAIASMRMPSTPPLKTAGYFGSVPKVANPVTTAKKGVEGLRVAMEVGRPGYSPAKGKENKNGQTK